MSIHSSSYVQDKDIILYAPKDKRRRGEVKSINCNLIRNEKLYVPLSYGLKKGSTIDKSNHAKIDIQFKGSLRDEQKIPYNLFFNSLMEDHTSFLSARTGLGKTILAIKAICDLGLRAMVFIHIKSNIMQWNNEIQEFTNARVCILEKFRKKTIPEADIYLGTKTEIKYMNDDMKASFGILICDEARLQCTQLCVHAMMAITPRYAIALSADYYREDGMHRAIDLMFGKESILVKDERKMTVWKMYTGFVPKIYNKKIDWSDIVNQMSADEERNKYITKCAIDDVKNGRKIIIECERSDKIKHIDILYNMLKEELGNKYKISTYYGDMSGYDNCDILIVSIKKGGVGFDAKSACKDTWDGRHFDVVYLSITGKLIQQKVGRARAPEITIRHFIDNFSSCEKHWLLNKKWYSDRGGETTYKEAHAKMLI